LREAVGELAVAGLRALVITGDGSSFCAGADLGGVYGDAFRTALYDTLHSLTALPTRDRSRQRPRARVEKRAPRFQGR
jgi:enoyl-CoA hydratase